MDSELITAFQNQQNKSEINDVVKELFDKDKIFMIADMSKEEIQISTRIKLVSDMMGIEEWGVGLEFYTAFLLSKDRKSRREILTAVTTMLQNKNNLLQKMNPLTWGRT